MKKGRLYCPAKQERLKRIFLSVLSPLFSQDKRMHYEILEILMIRKYHHAIMNNLARAKMHIIFLNLYGK
jgi:hypothetical protein